MKTSAKTYICDDCGRQDEFTSYIKARRADWAVAKDYSKCYCPNCAPDHRRGNALNARGGELPAGWQQLSIIDKAE